MTRSRPRSRTSYTGRSVERQSLPYFRTAALGALALTLAGCSTTGVDNTYTGSIVPAAATGGVDPSDWETVRRTLAEMGAEVLDLAWRNPRTGSSGTVTAFSAQPRADGTCRAFVTTVNDYRGIRRYRGEACRAGNADWRLTGIVAEDSLLL
ncbi:MAG TPA: RT0821/Lpp0805 family surface protein [Bauldia sp.]|nr:RT0821/Lpp0805 family surface protein [Bauldia sp.]